MFVHKFSGFANFHTNCSTFTAENYYFTWMHIGFKYVIFPTDVTDNENCKYCDNFTQKYNFQN